MIHELLDLKQGEKLLDWLKLPGNTKENLPHIYAALHQLYPPVNYTSLGSIELETPLVPVKESPVGSFDDDQCGILLRHRQNVRLP